MAMDIINRWEIFDPTDGRPVLRVPFKWLAWLVVRAQRRTYWDYERTGQGWIDLA
jgi:hypothetical protein